MTTPLTGIYPGLVDTFGRSVTLKRYAAPTLSATTGRYTRSSSTDSSIVAAYYPATGEQLKRLPENQRTEWTLAIHTKVALQTASAPAGAQADRLVIGGDTFEVVSVKAWDSDGWEALAQKVGQ